MPKRVLQSSIDLGDLKKTTAAAKQKREERERAETEQKTVRERKRKSQEETKLKGRRLAARRAMHKEAKRMLAEIEREVQIAASRGENSIRALRITFPISGELGEKLDCPVMSGVNIDPNSWTLVIERLPLTYRLLWKALDKFERRLTWKEDGTEMDDCENPYESNRVNHRWTEYTHHYDIYISW